MGEFQGDEMELLAYFEATYVGRRGPVERRRPPCERERWNAASRFPTGSLRANRAIASSHKEFAGSIAQAARPNVARFHASIHTQKNMCCGEIDVSENTPTTDRDLAVIESGA